MEAPDTVTEAVELLTREGYVDDFRLCADGIVAAGHDAPHPTSTAIVDFTFRFEGDSDPGDEAIVLGVRCATCGRRGILVSAFGPAADPAAFAHLVNLVPPPGAEPASG